MPRNSVHSLAFCMLLAFVLSSSTGNAQADGEKRFKAGEALTYSIYYYFMGVWVGAGDVTFSVADTIYMGNEVYHFKGYGATYPRYDWFYKVRDTYQAYSNRQTLTPYRFSRNVSEGGFYYREENIYDYGDSLIYSILKVKENPLKLDTLPIKPKSFDVLSLVYHSRSIDFSQYRIGDKIPIRMVIDRETFDLHIRFLGSEVYEHDDFGDIPCYVFSPLLVEGSIFKAGEGMKVYVSKDQNRIPVYIESQIRVGEIRSELKEYRGLKWPLVTQ